MAPCPTESTHQRSKKMKGGPAGWQREGRTQTHDGTGQSTGGSTHTEMGTDLQMNENRKESLYPRSGWLNEAKVQRGPGRNLKENSSPSTGKSYFAV